MKLFKTFRLDTANHLLWRNGDRVPLAPKAFDVLAYLVEHAGRLVTQDEILEALWPETYVNPEVLRKYILEIRKVLGDRPNNSEFVETVPKRGYRFVAPVLEESEAEPLVAAMSPAIEEPSKEESVGPATVRSGQESSTSKYRLWKLAVLPVLVVLAAAAIAGQHSGRTKSGGCYFVEEYFDRRAALCRHERGQRRGVFFRWTGRTTD